MLAPWLEDPHQLQRFAEVIDLSTALTLDRLLEPVLGPGASARNPEENDAAVPWLTPLKLGYRVHLTLELIPAHAARLSRLVAATGQPSPRRSGCPRDICSHPPGQNSSCK